MRLPLTPEPPREVNGLLTTPVLDADGKWILFKSVSLGEDGKTDWLSLPEVTLIREANAAHARLLALVDIHRLVDGLRYGDDPIEVADTVQRIVEKVRG